VRAGSTPASPIRVVTFDFWNTLIRADYSGVGDRRLVAWLGLLAGEGLSFERDVVRGALKHGSTRFDDAWREGRIYRAEDAVADILDHLGIDASEQLQADLLQTITDPDPAHDPKPNPNIAETLAALRERDVRIGIICDVGLAPSRTLRRYLERHELLSSFDHWSFSDEVGCFKPDPQIFAHALDGLGAAAGTTFDPSEAAHIGDLRRTDIAGAQGCGWFAVRYTGAYDDPGSADEATDTVEGDAVIADHADLLSVLGLT
jgi:putative hydrolase of the HAD superfamily